MRDLKQARPTVPSRSTFFFFSIPGFTSWHSGALVRWAYRDSSLQGYYLREFSLDKAHRGPQFYFKGQGARLVEVKPDETLPEVVVRALLSDDLRIARDALLLELELKPDNPNAVYCLTWVKWAQGDTASAMDLLKQLGVIPRPGPMPELSQAEAFARSGEIDQAIDLLVDAIPRHVLDPAGHGLLADLLLARGDDQPPAFIAALAARVLDPENPKVWRRWGMIQYYNRLYRQAKSSLEQYLALGGPAEKGDREAREALDAIPRLLAGGDLAQQDVRRDPLKARSREGARSP